MLEHWKVVMDHAAAGKDKVLVVGDREGREGLGEGWVGPEKNLDPRITVEDGQWDVVLVFGEGDEGRDAEWLMEGWQLLREGGTLVYRPRTGCGWGSWEWFQMGLVGDFMMDLGIGVGSKKAVGFFGRE